MTCRIAYVCGKQGLPIIPVLREIVGSEKIKAFLSPVAFNQRDEGDDDVELIESPEMLRAGLEAFHPDIIFVMTYLSKLDSSLSELSTFGMINIHPSLLPKYRGGAPIFYALKSGEEAVGLTYHFLTEVFDQGAIIEQAIIKVTPADCASSVWMKVIKKIITTLPTVIENRTRWVSLARNQDESVATSVGFPSWDELGLSTLKTISENLNIIRACGRAVGARLSLGRHTIFVTEACERPLSGQTTNATCWLEDSNTFLIRVSDGWLEISAATLDGKLISSWAPLMEGINGAI